MLVFGLGAALPLLIIGLLSREAVLLILIGALVLAGFDKRAETTVPS